MSTPARRFAIGEEDFLLDGEPTRILSGALHYFRVHPDLWADRIVKAREMGLNTIETYVAWNAHSKRPGRFDTDGGLDLGRFLDTVAEHGMRAIVRPGPYICAEWDNGGLPAWLFQQPGTGIRSSEPTYLKAVEEYYEHLAPILVPRQIDRGGPIIMVQVENEYGAYGKDKAYLKALTELTRRIGITVPLFTVDQPLDDMIDNGSLPELHKTASFGSRVNERLDRLRRHQPTGPLMCAEFWDGWFDSWGGHHHVTDVAEIAKSLDELLARGASVNIYMFHGGTNFGFTNGANDKGTYVPIVTSYDYDAPLDEAGNPTAKYWAMRDVIAKYTSTDETSVGSAERRTALPSPRSQSVRVSTAFDSVAPLWQIADRLGAWSKHEELPTSDSLGHYSGFTLYRTEIERQGSAILQLGEVRDRAQVFVDQRSIGVLARDHRDRALTLPDDAKGTLDLLVEDQGRVDYGPRIGEPKGLIGPATVNGAPVTGWHVLPLNLDDIAPVSDALRARSGKGGDSDSDRDRADIVAVAGPAFARATFDAPAADGDGAGAAITDLFLDTIEWGKGVAWINGFCLGRYWSRGPQRTLYVPAPVLKATDNELIILELHATASAEVCLLAQQELGHTEF
ncbi:beta-galactosidase family protein [Actinospica sp.]|jgi:beta-galactosidase|uniref:glycoside hydrolase family 35 protein n=1 Tax=Actinospica sp. TaxID=1872142 RepID=UPI002C14CE97|nr:beta-galactosidase family protein [Actinospica sp.]HWG25110.1 beta-galactosidase family protein [Actinospica sp.]